MKKLLIIGIFCLGGIVYANGLVPNTNEKSIPEKSPLPEIPAQTYAILPTIIDGKDL